MNYDRDTWYWFTSSTAGEGIVKVVEENGLLMIRAGHKTNGEFLYATNISKQVIIRPATDLEISKCLKAYDSKRPSDQAGMKLSTGSTGGRAKADLSSLIILGTIIVVLAFCLLVSKLFPKDKTSQDALEYKIDSAYQVGYIEGRDNAVDAIKAERTDTTVIPCQDGTIND